MVKTTLTKYKQEQEHEQEQASSHDSIKLFCFHTDPVLSVSNDNDAVVHIKHISTKACIRIMVGGINTGRSRPDPLSFVAKMIFFTKGKGLHKDYLTSFELALRDAAISDLNLVSVSSIMPPECKIVTREEGRKHLLPGQIVFTVMAKSATNEPNRLIAASIGLARPADHSQYGYLSEHHSFGETAQRAGDYAEDMAMEMLATTIGLPDDPSLAWDQREEQWKLSGKIYKTHNFTQSAQGHKDGLWTTVLSAAVMIL